MEKFQNLTLKNNFMFCAAMIQDDNCRRLLEIVLEMQIKQVTIDYEKSLIYHPDYHGVRLDIIAEDEDFTHYNVEMQVLKAPLKKRSRYYHSQIDMSLLLAGEEYEKLPDVYVIFICDFDPFGYQKYKYTKVSCCIEEPRVDFSDGSHTIYLSTHGTNEDDVPKELIKFLKYVKEGPLGIVVDDDPTSYIQILQNSINRIKADRSMEEKYMLLEEMLRRERKEGIEEGLQKGMKENILYVISANNYNSNEIENMISKLTNTDDLKKLFVYVLQAKSKEDIEAYLHNLVIF